LLKTCLKIKKITFFCHYIGEKLIKLAQKDKPYVGKTNKIQGFQG
jgi:hypothetical protein